MKGIKSVLLLGLLLAVALFVALVSTTNKVSDIDLIVTKLESLGDFSSTNYIEARIDVDNGSYFIFDDKTALFIPNDSNNKYDIVTQETTKRGKVKELKQKSNIYDVIMYTNVEHTEGQITSDLVVDRVYQVEIIHLPLDFYKQVTIKGVTYNQELYDTDLTI